MNDSDNRDKLYIVQNLKRTKNKNISKKKKNKRNSSRTQKKNECKALTEKKTVCWTWGEKHHSSTYDYKIVKLFYGIFIYYLLRKLFIVILMRTNFYRYNIYIEMLYKTPQWKTAKMMVSWCFAAFTFLTTIKIKVDRTEWIQHTQLKKKKQPVTTLN